MTTPVNGDAIIAIKEIVEQQIATQVHTVVAPGEPAESALTYLLRHPALTADNVTAAVDARRRTPRDRRGTVVLTGLQSFIDYVNRMKQPNTVLFADNANRSITAIFDYHDPINGPAGVLDGGDAEFTLIEHTAPEPRWGRSRAHFAFPFSTQWAAWAEANEKSLDQSKLAEHIEENILDVANITDPAAIPSASIREVIENLTLRLGGTKDLIQAARGFRVHATEQVATAVNLSSGEVSITYDQSHTQAGESPGKVTVPTAFILSIPVFHGDPNPEGLLVLLRYRKDGPAIKWTYMVYSMKSTLDRTFRSACDKIRDQVDLPLFYGAPAPTERA